MDPRTCPTSTRSDAELLRGRPRENRWEKTWCPNEEIDEGEMQIFYSGGVGGNQGAFDKFFPETFGLSTMLSFFQIKTRKKEEDRLKGVRSDTTRRFIHLKRRRV